MSIESVEIDFRERDLVFVDLETTGLSFLEHEIIQVGCLVVDGVRFEVKSEYEAKVKPEHLERASPKALEINGFSEEGWREALSLKDVLFRVVGIAPGGMITGWNVSFDWAFLEKGFREFGIESRFDYHRIDVMSIAYSRLLGKREVLGLGMRKVASAFGIVLPEEHDAMSDIKATYEIFRKLMVL